MDSMSYASRGLYLEADANREAVHFFIAQFPVSNSEHEKGQKNLEMAKKWVETS